MSQFQSSSRAMADCQVFTLQVQKTCSWNPGISPWWHIDLLKKAPTGWHVQTAPVLNPWSIVTIVDIKECIPRLGLASSGHLTKWVYNKWTRISRHDVGNENHRLPGDSRECRKKGVAENRLFKKKGEAEKRLIQNVTFSLGSNLNGISRRFIRLRVWKLMKLISIYAGDVHVLQ